FGADDEKGYLDKYSIRESVVDGTTVPLHYQLAPNDLLVDRETPEKEFLALAETEGISDIEELNKVLERAVTLKNMLKNEERVDKVARYVAEHYRSTIEPMGYKAFLVGVDREACALYKAALDEHLPSEYSEIVISTQGKKDSRLLRKYHLSDEEEQAIRKRFRKPDEQPKILIVTEKLLTGFDAPILYCMYLDKPMRDHVLLQAIARVNRPYEDDEGRRKPCGFVLDFVGIFDKLEKALAFDSQDVAGVIEGIDVLKQRFTQLMERGRQTYLPIPAGKRGDKAAESVLEHFRDKERREEFSSYFRELEELHEIISPDPFMRPFLDDYRELASISGLLTSSYDRGMIVDKSFLRKTALLVRQHTQTDTIHDPLTVYELNPRTLAAIADQDKPDTVKVFNLLKTIDRLIETEAGREPYLFSIGEKAEQIAQAFEDRQKTTQGTLEELRKLIQEINEARQEREATELSAESFAVYWLLKKEGVEQADTVVKAAADAFAQYPHWQVSSHQEQEVRKSFYKALINAGVQGVVDVAQNILRMLRKATP
ncbi:MAG: type I restriction enzyme subunit R domain-containing protein, partial [Candidatus Binatia bacterium]